MERVISGGRFSKSFYCGRCDHEWHVADSENAGAPPAPIEPVVPSRSKPRTRGFEAVAQPLHAIELSTQVGRLKVQHIQLLPE